MDTVASLDSAGSAVFAASLTEKMVLWLSVISALVFHLLCLYFNLYYIFGSLHLHTGEWETVPSIYFGKTRLLFLSLVSCAWAVFVSAGLDFPMLLLLLSFTH